MKSFTSPQELGSTSGSCRDKDLPSKTQLERRQESSKKTKANLTSGLETMKDTCIYMGIDFFDQISSWLECIMTHDTFEVLKT